MSNLNTKFNQNKIFINLEYRLISDVVVVEITDFDLKKEEKLAKVVEMRIQFETVKEKNRNIFSELTSRICGW